MSPFNRPAARSIAGLCLVAALGCSSSPDNPTAGSGGDSATSTVSTATTGAGGDDVIFTGSTSSGMTDGGVPDADPDASADGGTVCGNGIIEAGETCDDGNAKPGDGCDGLCHLEANYLCPEPGKPCVYHATAACGNGKVESGEQCDDGTKDGKLGCSATCQVIPGWTCPPAGGACTKDPVCGNGTVESLGGEQCDDGKNDGAHGCSTTCQVIKGWKCPGTGGPCTLDLYCGNGTIEQGEQCDDHNLKSYDGCSSTCFVEAGWSCPPAGGACTRICGNGVIDPGETCDDGSFYSGDGCSSTCKIEKDYSCLTPGMPCIFTPPPPPPLCGNGVIEMGEICDDGNDNGGDGCSTTCQVESGWSCSAPNQACVAAKCGDGILAGNEQCDDGFVNGLHGCSSTCTIMPNAVCPPAGGACIPMVCGDGKVTGTETCDDGVNDGLHGCSATCSVVSGWICPFPGTPCIAVCGDGIVTGHEECDEGADVPCCTACKVNTGFVCDPTKNPHSQPATAYCGNGVVEGPSNVASQILGNEQCDDGNTLPFDGCSPTCTNEPLCGTLNTSIPNPTPVPFQCFARCGDGLVLPPEQCDDGNTQNGDGCDSTCNIELVPGTNQPAWTCAQPPPGASLQLPVVWRDFTPTRHPQFSVDPLVNRRLPSITQPSLGQVALGGGKVKYVPTYNTAFVSPTFGTGASAATNLKPNWTMDGPGWVAGFEPTTHPAWWNNTMSANDTVLLAGGTPTLATGNASVLATPAGRFAQWYVDDPTVNITYTSTLTLTQIAAGTYQYSCDTTGCDSAFSAAAPIGFFPLDGLGWVTQPGEEKTRDGGHNYSFTTETRYWFVYKGGERLDFYGDDDLWVFVNGQLALDLGGVHSKLSGFFQLSTAAAPGTAQTCTENIPGEGANAHCSFVPLNLQLGHVYEISVFNAEREILDSNFQLTLQGFNGSPSVCKPICGDGYVAGDEQCDRGALNVSPASNTYGKCTTQCKLGPFCGDVLVTTPPEACDNGLNIDAYVTFTPSAGMCAPGCVTPSFCGDSITQKPHGEQCDDGPNNQPGYNHCQPNCTFGPRCGDGSIQAPNGEQCDDGPNNGAPSSPCSATCVLKCGNDTVDAGEDCDDGTGPSGNGTAASLCTSNCHWKCGNGQLDMGEQCDDGKNDGSYGTCNADCTLAPYCGDSLTLTPPEACDNGPNNTPTAYGPTACTDQCLPGGFCGDGLVNGPEKCDDGKNTGMPGSCTPDCSAYVPSAQCGDGTVQPPEKCDDGTGPTGNGSATSKCDTLCRFSCGNGQPDPGEDCDNGVNDGSYGTCGPTCKLAGYCGDGTKNGPEQCDSGANNVSTSTAYGPGVCTIACSFAPFCGDGAVQAQFGEQCEGPYPCDKCKWAVAQ